MTDDKKFTENASGLCHLVDIEFTVDPLDLFHGWCIYRYLHAK